MGKKTDNANLKAKLDLRRYFLRKYHADGMARVVDCCQATGKIWGILRNEFDIANYWGMDEVRKPGRLKIKSERYLSQPGWPENVVDIDTYGLPWKHWYGMQPFVTQPVTVFLTIGSAQGLMMASGQPVSNESRIAVNLGSLAIPQAFGAKINRIAVSYCLVMGCGKNKILEAVEAVSYGNARYIGVRVDPAERIVAGSGNFRPLHTQAERSIAHV